MKLKLISQIAVLLAGAGAAFGQAGDTYTNFVRQVQLPTNVVWDVTVTDEGEQLSPLAIDPGGARFELWTVKSDPLTVYLLDTKYVGTYVPMAEVTIRSEDPYAAIPRTRADRPFIVDITTSGLRSDEDAPEASKSVKLLHHAQSYGADGVGEGIDRNQALLISQVTLTNNALHRLSYPPALKAVPGADRSKIRGEERFSVFSLQDYQAPPSQVASMFIQIWPVADGTITGISEGQILRFTVPQVTLTLNDLYPDSRTYAQVYKGSQQLGKEGTVIPGSALIVYDSVPKNDVLVLKDYEAVFDSDGTWTMELVTATPFGPERLAFVSFEVSRTINVNGTVTTIE